MDCTSLFTARGIEASRDIPPFFLFLWMREDTSLVLPKLLHNGDSDQASVLHMWPSRNVECLFLMMGKGTYFSFPRLPEVQQKKKD